MHFGTKKMFRQKLMKFSILSFKRAVLEHVVDNVRIWHNLEFAFAQWIVPISKLLPNSHSVGQCRDARRVASGISEERTHMIETCTIFQTLLKFVLMEKI